METRRTSELQKRSFFVDAVNFLDVRLLNTWGERSIHNWTCACEHREARQIDFLEFPGVSHINAPYRCMILQPRNLTHRAFLLSVKGRPRSRIMTRRKQPKPIRWYLTDRASGVSDVDGSNAWRMWCDGGTRTAPLVGHRKRRVTVVQGGVSVFSRKVARHQLFGTMRF